MSSVCIWTGTGGIITNSLWSLWGGDFNILRYSDEKNKTFKNNMWSDLFSRLINTYELRDLQLTGRKYTWGNNQHNPTLERLDRVLMNKEWKNLFPPLLCFKKDPDTCLIITLWFYLMRSINQPRKNPSHLRCLDWTKMIASIKSRKFGQGGSGGQIQLRQMGD